MGRAGTPSSLFQSTPPSQGATWAAVGLAGTFLFQSTPPSQGATAIGRWPAKLWRVSIHAPLTGSDDPTEALTVFA